MASACAVISSEETGAIRRWLEGQTIFSEGNNILLFEQISRHFANNAKCLMQLDFGF